LKLVWPCRRQTCEKRWSRRQTCEKRWSLQVFFITLAAAAAGLFITALLRATMPFVLATAPLAFAAGFFLGISGMAAIRV